MSGMEIAYIVLITIEAATLVFWLGYEIGKAKEESKYIKAFREFREEIKLEEGRQRMTDIEDLAHVLCGQDDCRECSFDGECRALGEAEAVLKAGHDKPQEVKRAIK